MKSAVSESIIKSLLTLIGYEKAYPVWFVWRHNLNYFTGKLNDADRLN
jgi:hypothetical protein